MAEAPAGGPGFGVAQDDFHQRHEELVFAETWWWAVHISLCAVALIANFIFLVTVIYNRYDHKQAGESVDSGDSQFSIDSRLS